MKTMLLLPSMLLLLMCEGALSTSVTDAVPLCRKSQCYLDACPEDRPLKVMAEGECCGIFAAKSLCVDCCAAFPTPEPSSAPTTAPPTCAPTGPPTAAPTAAPSSAPTAAPTSAEPSTPPTAAVHSAANPAANPAYAHGEQHRAAILLAVLLVVVLAVIYAALLCRPREGEAQYLMTRRDDDDENPLHAAFGSAREHVKSRLSALKLWATRAGEEAEAEDDAHHWKKNFDVFSADYSPISSTQSEPASAVPIVPTRTRSASEPSENLTPSHYFGGWKLVDESDEEQGSVNF